jgi:hypothetical protein
MVSKKDFISIAVIIVLFINFGYSAYKKLAQTGFQFLSVGSDARAAGMAGAMTTICSGSNSLFFNPATMTEMNNFIDFSAGQNNWIADITHNALSLAFNPAGGRYGVVGLSLLYVDYGELQGTMVWGNDQGFIPTEIFNPSSISIGVGYALALSTKFSAGGQVKYTGQQFGESVVEIGEADSLAVKKYRAFTLAFDFGTLFKTGFKSFEFGMSVRNFAGEMRYEDEGFQLPLTFSIGASMDILDFWDNIGKPHTLLVSVDAVHPRSYPEYINLGIEYGYNDILFLRYGLESNRDECASNFGFGINIVGLIFDYSYTPFGVFDDVQRFTLRFSL